MISFASDNCAPVHPRVMEALAAANTGHVPSYGEDAYTEELSKKLNELFGREVYSFLMLNGTGANSAAMAHITRGYSSVICSDISHMHTDEAGAPERIAGIKLLTSPHENGKLTPGGIERFMYMHGCEHYTQPRAVSITQSTEFGTVYTPGEVRAISEAAHRFGMLVYMDGARAANAAAHLNIPIAEFTVDAGVDILCFGGTKNGAMYGECLIFFDKWLGKQFYFTRKNTAQLVSKMRYAAVQFLALLENGLWLENASHANKCATYFEAALKRFSCVRLAFPVQANELFFSMERNVAEKLLEDFDFLEHDGYWRVVTSFDTEKGDIDAFVNKLQGLSS